MCVCADGSGGELEIRADVEEGAGKR